MKNTYILIGFLLLGIFFRTEHLLEQRSLWVDEAYVALDISVVPLDQIVQGKTLFPDQPRTPVLFRTLTKIFTIFFGNNEISLRLFSYIFGILSLVAFGFFVKNNSTNTTSGIMALGFFVFSPALIYYSSEVKPYMGDVFVCTLILCLLPKVIKPKTLSTVIWLSLGGVIAPWFSFGSLFVFCAYFIVAIASLFLKSERIWRENIVIVLFFWFCSFSIAYVSVFSHMVSSKYILSTMQNVFFPPAPFQWLTSTKWTIEAFSNIFTELLGFGFGWSGGVLFFIGIWMLIRSKKTVWASLFLILIFLPLIAAFFQKYPFKQRFILFLSPVLCYVVAESIASVGVLIKHRIKGLMVFLICGFLIFSPTVQAFKGIRETHGPDDMKSAVQYLKERFEPTDLLYVDNHSRYILGYYLGRYDLNSLVDFWGVVLIYDGSGVDNKIVRKGLVVYEDIFYTKEGFLLKAKRRGGVSDKLADVNGDKRSWLVLLHPKDEDKKWAVNYMQQNAVMIDSKDFPGVNVYLFKGRR